jgi:hypothetical protein
VIEISSFWETQRSVSLPSLEDGNRYSFRNGVVSIYFYDGQRPKPHWYKVCNSKQADSWGLPSSGIWGYVVRYIFTDLICENPMKFSELYGVKFKKTMLFSHHCKNAKKEKSSSRFMALNSSMEGSWSRSRPLPHNSSHKISSHFNYVGWCPVYTKFR